MSDDISIRIHDHFGENLLTPEEGEGLLAMLQSELGCGRSVEIDFAGVRIVTSAFFNAAIGRLYDSYSHDDVREHLQVSNLSDIGRFTLKRVVENSKTYYENAKHRDALDSAAKTVLEA